MKMHLLGSVCVAVSLLLTPTWSRAERPLWELGFGLGAVRLPHYRGADQAHNWLLPVPYVVYRGDFFQADREGTRAVLLNRRDVDLDISLDLSAPVRSEGSRARAGMSDLPATLEVGPNLNITLARGERGGQPWKLDLRLPMRAGLTLNRAFDRTGLSFSPRLNLDWRVFGWNLGVQGGPSWGDRRRHDFFYGVSADQATAARPAYGAQGGFAGWEGTLALSRRQANTWTGLYVSVDSLSDARFASSPLVRQRTTWSAGVAMAWVLKSSSVMVPDEKN